MMREPVRLAKPEDDDMGFDILRLLDKYSPYIIVALIVIVVLLIIALVFAVAHAGGANITMVESGNWYNHFQDVI